MKKIVLLLLLMCTSLLCNAQEKMSVVTLKSGTELKGVIKTIDPLDALTIVIAGVETTIKMTDVAKVEEVIDHSIAAYIPQRVQLSPNEKLIVTDTSEYPDSFLIEVCGEQISMILIRGGEMNMGFDGDDSMDYNSEPIHRVSVTSFYLSKRCISVDLAKQLTDKKYRNNHGFYCAKWENVDAMAKAIADKVALPLRLPTEAEWEFAACSKQQNKLFVYNDDDEFCSDYFGEFSTLTEGTIDPIGPSSGRRHVVRYYGKGDKKFDRDHSDAENRMRLAIKAKNINL